MNEERIENLNKAIEATKQFKIAALNFSECIVKVDCPVDVSEIKSFSFLTDLLEKVFLLELENLKNVQN